MPAPIRGKATKPEELDKSASTTKRTAERAPSSSLQSVLGVGSSLTPGNALELQRLVGNRATGEIIQRKGGKGKKKKRNRNRNKGGGGGGQTQTQTPTPTPTPTPQPEQSGGIMGGLTSVWNYFTGATSVSSDNEGDTTLAGQEIEGDISGTTEEKPPDLIKIPRVVIDLGTKDLLKGPFGDLKASGKVGGGMEGFEAKGKLEYEYGTGEERDIGNVDLKVLGGQLTAKGTSSTFIGTKAKLELEAQLDSENWGGKGKLGAFSGLEKKYASEVVLMAGGQELGKFKGAMGWTIGIGGELSASFSWPKGGSWKVAYKGKFAVGVGGSWEYELQFPVATFASTLWSWVSSWGSSWASWAYDCLMAGSG